ncbi:hypothetical protein C8Q78DRAFT_101901 [Trametes maxima]|nr:hypothetical protein C8Q78DRAFT_101901 [Trametes maxima]
MSRRDDVPSQSRRRDERRGGEPHDAREGDGWSRHGHHDPSLQDAAGWTPGPRHDDRAGGYSRSSQEGRSGQHDGRSRYENDWKDDRRDGQPREWQRDNGWESRRPPSASQSWDEPPRQWSSSHGESSHREDRAWEPSASWQPSRRDGGSNSNQRNQNNHSNKSKNKGKGSKKSGGNGNNNNNNNSNRQKRSWRDDDSQLNKFLDASGCAILEEERPAVDRETPTAPFTFSRPLSFSCRIVLFPTILPKSLSLI